ncbi:hypothetical protein ACF0H5_017296 [Mactra antiquata]
MRGSEFVDSLTADGCMNVLKSMVEKTPNLILTVADEIQKGREASIDPIVPDQPEWHICTRRQEMPSDVSHVCFGMKPDRCHSNMLVRIFLIYESLLLHTDTNEALLQNRLPCTVVPVAYRV